jgi:hypothetical protein
MPNFRITPALKASRAAPDNDKKILSSQASHALSLNLIIKDEFVEDM